MRFTKLYILTVIIAGAAVVSACILFLSFGYDSLISQILQASGKPYLEATLRNSVFSIAKFSLLRKLCIMLLFIVPLLAFLLIIYRRYILQFATFMYHSLQYSWLSLKDVFISNSRRQNMGVILVLTVVAVRSVYYLLHYDLQYDEMWSYNYFTAQPFYYPFVVSSNYPLYEISTQLFKYLPFEMKINIRLPVLIAGITSCIVFYACARKYFNTHLAALGGMALFAFMPVSAFYMMYARGVMFNLFFAVIAIFSVLFWVKNSQQKRHLIIYALANAMGMYSMPTHVYIWFLLFLFSFAWCLLYNRRQLLPIVVANAGAAIFSLLLYAPIAAGSGLSYLLSASVDNETKPFSLAEIAQYNRDISWFFTGSYYGCAVVLLMVFFVLLLTKTYKKYSFLFLFGSALCLIPACTCALQNVQIPLRALSFCGLYIPLLFCVLLSVGSVYIKPSLIAIFIIITSAGAAVASHFHSYLSWSIQQDKDAKSLASLFLQHHIATCYDASAGSLFFYNHPAIEYYYRLDNETFTLFTNAENSLRYKPFTTRDKYDCIAYHSDDIVTDTSYHKWYENRREDFVIYLRNGK